MLFFKCKQRMRTDARNTEWAKAVDILGFIASWKDTIVLSPRLEMLTRIAEEEDFKLIIIYQGLDFDRNQLPSSQVAEDAV